MILWGRIFSYPFIFFIMKEGEFTSTTIIKDGITKHYYNQVKDEGDYWNVGNVLISKKFVEEDKGHTNFLNMICNMDSNYVIVINIKGNLEIYKGVCQNEIKLDRFYFDGDKAELYDNYTFPVMIKTHTVLDTIFYKKGFVYYGMIGSNIFIENEKIILLTPFIKKYPGVVRIRSLLFDQDKLTIQSLDEDGVTCTTICDTYKQITDGVEYIKLK